MACEALSYVVPKSFKRTRPRFSEEQFDIIVQRSKNFQPWNRDIRLDQRYAFIVLDGAESVTAVHVLSGLDVAALPQTGKRTIKFQARFRDYAVGRSEPVIHGPDTERLLQYRETNSHLAHALTVGVMPTGGLMTIHQIGAVLGGLLGESLSNPGATQERLRGQALHERVCDYSRL